MELTVDKIKSLVSGDQFMTVLLVIFLVAYFVYKEWPEFKERMTSDTKKELDRDNTDKDLTERVKALEESVRIMDGKLGNDFRDILYMKRETANIKEMIKDSLEERRILMKGMCACLDGLEQQGCNHTVPATKQMLEEFLNDQAHKRNVGKDT